MVVYQVVIINVPKKGICWSSLLLLFIIIMAIDRFEWHCALNSGKGETFSVCDYD